MNLINSPVTQHQFEQHDFYLKRDDLLHAQFSGNKARKFMSLLENDYPNIDCLVGYGSVQANSLYSLAALCHLKKWTLHFYVDHIASYVKQSPRGNYRGALELGAEIIDLSQQDDRKQRHASDYIRDTYAHQSNAMIIPEGGRSPIAEHGVAQLAKEIKQWKVQQQVDNLVVALPSGTGTTAFYLQKHLSKENIEVLTCACVGNRAYLTEQFAMLEQSSNLPTILAAEQKHQFGRLDLDDYQLWQSLHQQTGIEFDLLYDPFMWRCLKPWMTANKDKTLMYIHQGGLLGNESMLGRYQRMLRSR